MASRSMPIFLILVTISKGDKSRVNFVLPGKESLIPQWAIGIKLSHRMHLRMKGKIGRRENLSYFQINGRV